LDTNPSTTYQQLENSPCVIGEPSCNNPAGFDKTILSPGNSTYSDVGSPTYTIQQIRDIVGDTFSIGIDVNTTTQPTATEILDMFRLDIDGTTAFSYTGPTQLMTNNNGNGYSDALLNGFDISGYLGSLSAQFFVSYHDATDGREQFFLIGSNPPPRVPEPASATLFGLGLLGAAMRKRIFG
jgi:hypothetical protein